MPRKNCLKENASLESVFLTRLQDFALNLTHMVQLKGNLTHVGSSVLNLLAKSTRLYQPVLA